MSDNKVDPEPLLTFPCRFPIKIMGRDKPGFRETVVTIVERHAGNIDDDAVRQSVSSKRAFVSVTVTIEARSQEQLDCIYRDLSDHDDIMFSL